MRSLPPPGLPVADVNRATAWSTHLAVALSAGTGIVYGWMRYLCVPEDEFAIVNHPWQPDLQHFHIIVVPLLVFVCGLLWSTHVWPRVKSGFRSRRTTGLVLAAGLLPMVLSGYLVQVVADETWRLVWVWTHGVTSTLWTLGYLVHQLAPRRRAAPATEE